MKQYAIKFDVSLVLNEYVAVQAYLADKCLKADYITSSFDGLIMSCSEIRQVPTLLISGDGPTLVEMQKEASHS